MKRTKQKRLAFFVILFFCFLIRLLYHTFNPDYQTYTDSVQYIDRAAEIAFGKPYINPLRYPLYPLILSAMARPVANPGMPSDIHIDIPTVVRFQQVLGLFTAVAILICAYLIFPNTSGFVIFGILFSLFINFFAFEKNILTENVAVFLLSILSLLCILYIKRKQFI